MLEKERVMKERIRELRQAIGKATEDLAALTADPKAFEAKEAELTQMEGELTRSIALQQRIAAQGQPAGTDGLQPGAEPGGVQAGNFATVDPDAASMRGNGLFGMDGKFQTFDDYVRRARAQLQYRPDPNKDFRSFGEQLKAIANYSLSRGGTFDNRLKRAPTGAGEVDPTGGGFLVQTDFAQAIFMLSHTMGDVLGRVNKLPIGENSNGVKIKAIDETSRATGSRWGGVQSYWVGEGQTPAFSRPKFREVDFSLKKLMSVMYMTDELLQDSTALTSIASTAFAEEVMFMTEDSIFEGTGVGQPLGILKSPGRVTVAKASGQATGTILLQNIEQMWSQCWIRSRKNAVWFINQEIEPQLFALNQPVSTAGGALVFMPPGGVSGLPYATLFGRPIIPTEYNAALSTEGDIVLADMSQYQLVDKGGVNAQTSMHVAFLTDEMVFRITYRVDGRPMWYAPLTPFRGSTAKSPFITLQTR
jgi:HK97 family phage major capsid protein